MKKLLYTVALTLLVSGCTTLRYSFENAINQVPKDATITRVTNDYVEYEKYTTNTSPQTVITTHKYRAYYTTDGTVYETKQVP